MVRQITVEVEPDPFSVLAVHRDPRTTPRSPHDTSGRTPFHRVRAPSNAGLEWLLDKLIRRITRTLLRAGHDILTGGAGANTFSWGENDRGSRPSPDSDTILDFESGSIQAQCASPAHSHRDLLEGGQRMYQGSRCCTRRRRRCRPDSRALPAPAGFSGMLGVRSRAVSSPEHGGCGYPAF
jgi:hypothetical protein